MKIALREDKAAIEKFAADLNNTLTLLNQVNRLLPINSISDIPSNVNAYIFGKCLEDPLTAQIHERTPLTLEQLNIPSELRALSGLLGRWQSASKEGLEMVKKDQAGSFHIDPDEIDKYCDRWRTFATTSEQIERFEICKQYIELISKVADGPEAKIKFDNPLVSWGKGLDEKSLHPEINLPFVFTGQIR